MNDAELLKQHRDGNEHAFAELVRRHLGWIYGVAHRRVGNVHQAEDVAQVVFILLHRKAPNFASDGALIAWLHTTAWRAAKVAARGEKRRRDRESNFAEQKLMLARKQDQSDELASRELARMLDKLIEHLPRADAEAILLRYYKDLSFAEIAVVTKSSPEAARKRVGRAVAKLQRLAGERWEGVPSAGMMLQIATQLHPVAPPSLIAATTITATAPIGAILTTEINSILKGVRFMAVTSKTTILIATLMICFLIAGTTWQILSAGVVPMAQVPSRMPATQSVPTKEAASIDRNVSQNEDLEKPDLGVPAIPPVQTFPSGAGGSGTGLSFRSLRRGGTPQPIVNGAAAPVEELQRVGPATLVNGYFVGKDGTDLIVDSTNIGGRGGRTKVILPTYPETQFIVDGNHDAGIADLKPGMFIITGNPRTNTPSVSALSDPQSSLPRPGTLSRFEGTTLVLLMFNGTEVKFATDENTRVNVPKASTSSRENSAPIYFQVPGTLEDIALGMRIQVTAINGVAKTISVSP